MYEPFGREHRAPKRRSVRLRPGGRLATQRAFAEKHRPLDTLKLAVPTKENRAKLKGLGVITSDSFPSWAREFEGKSPDKVIIRQRSGGMTGFMSGVREGDTYQKDYTCIGTLVYSDPKGRSYDVSYLMERGKVRII